MKATIANVDFGKTADDYLTHRAGFPDSLFTRLKDMGFGRTGETLIDLGTGTGTLGRGFARSGCVVTGLDPSAEMLAAAKQIDRKAGLVTKYVQATAEHTTLPDQCADIVSAGQCWHWFEPVEVCREINRILKPGGALVIAHYDWIPLKGNVVRETEKLIEACNPDWRMGKGTGIHPWAFRELAESGFENLQSFSYDEAAVYSHEGWRGRIRASAGVSATLDKTRVVQFDDELGALLTARFPEDPLEVPHRVFVITARKPS